VAVFAVWLLLFVTGREQYRRVTRRTEELVLRMVQPALKANPAMTLPEFYRLLMPEWRQMLKKSAWYMTHKTELFPIPARPELVIKRMGLDETYVGQILLEHQIQLAGYEFKKVQKATARQIRKRRNG
jgi:hypothetical protein